MLTGAYPSGSRPTGSNPQINSGAVAPQPATISLVGASANAVASGTITINLPAGLAVGDTSFLYVAAGGSGGTITTPSGWTLLAGTASNTNNTVAAFRRAYAAGDPASVTITTSGTSTAGWIQSLRNAGAMTAANTSTVGFSNTPPAVAVTPTASGSWLLYGLTIGTQNATLTPPAGMTQPTEISTGGKSGTNFVSVGGAYEGPVATTSQSRQGTSSTGSALDAILMAIEPAAGGPTAITGTASGSVSVTGGASASTLDSAQASGTVGITGTSTASAIDTAQASSVVAITGNASGSTASADRTGSADGSLPITGNAQGTASARAEASGSLGITGSASAVAIDSAQGSGSIDVSGNASAAARESGVASGSLAVSGNAAATNRISGAAAGSLDVAGNAAAGSAGANRTGTASGGIDIAGSATGSSVDQASAAGAIAVTGDASAAVRIAAAAASPVGITGYSASSTCWR